MKLPLNEIQIKYRPSTDALDIYFYGTNSLGDILLYFQCWKKKHHIAGRIHAGIYKEYMKNREKIVNLIATFPDVKTVNISGYSLGGAWGKLLAVDVDLPTTVETKGDPRCGDQKFVDLFDVTTHDVRRYRYGRDIVPTLPPRWMGYRCEKGLTAIGPKFKWWQLLRLFTDHVKY